MARLNMIKALKVLGIPTSLAPNAYRLIYTLQSPKSQCYSPHAAITIKSLLCEIMIHRGKMTKRRDYLTLLFLGQVEALLVSTSTQYNILMACEAFDSVVNNRSVVDLDLIKPMPKVNFQEAIDSLLYGKPCRSITPLEGYAPNVRLGSENAMLLTFASVMRYLESTTDIEKRQRKLQWLKDQACSQTTNNLSSNFNRYLCEMLAAYITVYINENATSGGEAFSKIFNKLAKEHDVTDDTIRRCIKARNMAVHEGVCRCPNSILSVFLMLLILSLQATESSDNDIEEAVNESMSKDRNQIKTVKIISVAASVAIISMLGYIISMFVVGSYIGDSEIRSVYWPSNSPQLNARINELIATKDTVRLLELQSDMRWIEDNINKSTQKDSR